MYKNQKVLLYDGTLLANTFSRHNSDRTGVYFVVYNLFLEMMKQKEFYVVVYSDEGRREDVRRALKLFGYGNVVVVSELDYKTVEPEIFFATFAPAPQCIQDDLSVAKYMILYDVTPLALPEIEAPNQGWFDLLERRLNSDDHYIAISEYTKKDFIRFYPAIDEKKVTVSYLAASNNFYQCKDASVIKKIKQKYGLPTNKPYIFSLCTLQPRKNLVQAVKCFVEFVEENKIDDLYFVLGGGHWEEFIEILDREIEGSGKYKKHIIKTGYIDDEDLAPLYSGAMFSVYISLYEGFGLPVLEAMQCGCPVIASNSTSIPEVAGDAGILVDPQDKVEIKQAYMRLYREHAFRKNCSKKAVERSKQFSWKKCENEILDFILATCDNALLSQKQKIEQRKNKNKHKENNKEKNHVKLFGKQWTYETTTIRFFGIPVLREVRKNEVETIKFLGIPISKRNKAYYEIITTVFGIKIKREPNYEYIEKQIQLYTSSFANAMYQLGQRIEQKYERFEREKEQSIQEQIEGLESFQLVKWFSEHDVDISQEIKSVSEKMEKINSGEER